jgi:hypothetical protein
MRQTRWWRWLGGRGFVVGVAAALVAVAAWSALTAPRVALGQVPDSGAQRNDMIRELQESNKKLGEIAGLLREIRDQGKKDKDAKTPPAKP